MANSTAPLWEPAFILPSQLTPDTSHVPGPEIRLVAAVLEDALQCITKNVNARYGRRRRDFSEAYRWLWADNRDWPFAFRNVCDLLGLNASAVRQRIRRLIAAQRRDDD